ncbi:hypothetical protein NXT3_PB00193 (plasmid) [Sinorhizobium fredii]|uniref:Uncharacterized protein n=1 Tax=Rhizobium fredii TaxID=380 RepID=A0A2L0HBN5_RHIFR|nr:hypothetical protein NXT3_PB00193 [Sinorhizobium fredii]
MSRSRPSRIPAQGSTRAASLFGRKRFRRGPLHDRGVIHEMKVGRRLPARNQGVSKLVPNWPTQQKKKIVFAFQRLSLRPDKSSAK